MSDFNAPSDDLTRSVPFEITRTADDGDGLTFEGYAAVWDSPTEINSRAEGHFVEVMKRGSFVKTTNGRVPAFLFDHGQHPLIGSMPLGVIQEAREDDRGLFIRARFTDNWLIQPVRDACADGAIPGMSFRMSIPEGGQKWIRGKSGELPRREITEVKCYECGPVVFPAYADTSVGVRSSVDQLAHADRRDLARALFAAEERADTSNTDANYADPGYKDDGVKRYPVNTGAHVKAAWAYINMDRNQQGYTPEQIASIKSRIKSAAKKFGIEIGDETKSAEIDGETRSWMMSDLCAVVEDAIEDQLYEDQTVCVVDISDDGNAYFCIWNNVEMETYEVSFTIDDAGAVTLGTPAEVLKKTTYVPATSDEEADAGRNADPADEVTPQDTLDPADEVTPRGAPQPTDAETARFLRQLKARDLLGA